MLCSQYGGDSFLLLYFSPVTNQLSFNQLLLLFLFTFDFEQNKFTFGEIYFDDTVG